MVSRCMEMDPPSLAVGRTCVASGRCSVHIPWSPDPHAMTVSLVVTVVIVKVAKGDPSAVHNTVTIFNKCQHLKWCGRATLVGKRLTQLASASFPFTCLQQQLIRNWWGAGRQTAAQQQPASQTCLPQAYSCRGGLSGQSGSPLGLARARDGITGLYEILMFISQKSNNGLMFQSSVVLIDLVVDTSWRQANQVSLLQIHNCLQYFDFT